MGSDTFWQAFTEKPYLIPPCLRLDSVTAVGRLDSCALETISYYIWLLLLAVIVAAFFYILYAGFQMVTSLGDQAKFTAGRKTLQSAVIGIIIASLSFLIVNFTNNFLAPGGSSGIEVSVNPGAVTVGANAVSSSRKPPTAMAESELGNIEYGDNRSEIALAGKYMIIYLTDRREFKVKLTKPGKSDFSAVVFQKNGKYVARFYDLSDALDGGSIVIEQEVTERVDGEDQTSTAKKVITLKKSP